MFVLFTKTSELSGRPADLFTPHASRQHNSAHRPHKHEEHLSILLSLESTGTTSSPQRALMHQHQDIEPATAHLMKRLHSFTNRQERTTLVNRSMNIRTLTMVSARCQVHLGMLAKANKFSRVLALQNSSKGDGMSKMQLEFWNPQKATPTGNKTHVLCLGCSPQGCFA